MTVHSNAQQDQAFGNRCCRWTRRGRAPSARAVKPRHGRKDVLND